MSQRLKLLPLSAVRLLPSFLTHRVQLNRDYLMRLESRNLLQNHYLQAGLWSAQFRNTTHGDPSDGAAIHWGWESPTCQVRGQFLGHWLSAAARLIATTKDADLAPKAHHIVAELGRCQKENGGEWAGSIPPDYLEWIARGKAAWAPHYVVHKTMMGLFDMYAEAGNEQALEILVNWARWFHRWTRPFSREQMDRILDVETGGMLEAWANLYGATQRPEHLELVRRYDRPRLFDRLLAGEDPLTNQHANTTIPEAYGAARAWEVTGDDRWRRIAEAYWECAVTRRGAYCTGGQTCGEIWTPCGEFAARLGDKNQEHCTVYNMMRLAQYLYRWTGDPAYADYWERNFYNGLLAQQHHRTGMIAYFLPLQPGAKKIWGHPTHDFWCCHGTLVQAHTRHTEAIYYEDEAGLVVSQYLPSTCRWARQGAAVEISQTWDPQLGSTHHPQRLAVDLKVACERPVEFVLSLRLPWWISGPATVAVNGVAEEAPRGSSGFHRIRRTWANDVVRVELPKALTACPLPDRPDTVAFLDGPAVLAGLCDEERTLRGDPARPETLLAPDNEREWATWGTAYRALNQERGLRFIPLHEILDQSYTVYFPVRAAGAGLAQQDGR
jgi:DUF1680 family protein